MRKMSRVNVTIQFSRVIIFPQSDKGAVWWVGIRADHDRSFPPPDPVALHQRAKSSVAEGTVFPVQLSIALTPNASAWPQGFAFNYQLFCSFFFGASYCGHLRSNVQALQQHKRTRKNIQKRLQLGCYLLPDANCSPGSLESTYLLSELSAISLISDFLIRLGHAVLSPK